MSKTISSNALLGTIEDIPLCDLRLSKRQLRSSGQNLDELIDSIKQMGLLQPIIVRGLQDHYYEIISGNRRYEACRKLSWRKIACHIVELDDKESFEVSLIENVQRETLNPIEEARAYAIYIFKFGWGGVSELARKIGKSPSYVTKRIELLDLPHEIIQSIADSAVRPSVAQELHAIKDEVKQSELARLIAHRHLSLRKVRELVDQANQDGYGSDIEPYYEDCNERKRNVERAFDKSITALKIALNRLSLIIEDIEEGDSWPINQILLQHKNRVNDQIDTLLKERRKYSYYRII